MFSSDFDKLVLCCCLQEDIDKIKNSSKYNFIKLMPVLNGDDLNISI
ncbi:hypothetical protein MARI151_60670 [Maribacter litoralis]|uniref:Uncharacterized protein n=1 Tax=Maribacter litoralis TaxID=2059726 RepID=A0A653XRR5_9FLAO|nr:hypothetical protein MARI151_60670 [Maribacter litoralis]